MDSVKQLRRQYVDLIKSLYREGIVSRQIIHLQDMQSVDEFPQNLSGLVNQFFVHSERLLPKLDVAFERKLVDPEVKENVHRVKGSSMSVGAQKVTGLCIAFRDCYDTGNYEKCLQFLPQIKEEYHLVKNKLQAVLNLQQQILDIGGSVPILK